jgi:hypothetical protein
MKFFKAFLTVSLVLFLSSSLFSQSVKIGPRITGNYNIYSATGLTGSWNGIGIGVGGTVDVSFNQHIGIMGNLTMFDMKSFSNTQTYTNGTAETTVSLSYLTIDPMFKAEFSGFYMVAGPSIGIKLGASGEYTETATGGTPSVSPLNLNTKSTIFNIATGAGYTFPIADKMYLGTDFMAYIPLSSTFTGGTNSILSLKLGVALKFKI